MKVVWNLEQLTWWYSDQLEFLTARDSGVMWKNLVQNGKKTHEVVV